MAHSKTVCKLCEKVITQCRCMLPDKVIKYDVCKTCQKKWVKSVLAGTTEDASHNSLDGEQVDDGKVGAADSDNAEASHGDGLSGCLRQPFGSCGG